MKILLYFTTIIIIERIIYIIIWAFKIIKVYNLLYFRYIKQKI